MTLSAPSASVSLDIPGGQLAIQAGELTLDEGWSPFIQGTLVCPIASPARLAQLDPRRPGARAQVWLEQSFSASGPVAELSAAYGAGTVAGLTAAWGAGSVADITSAWSRPLNPGAPRQPRQRLLNLSLRSARIDYLARTVTLGVASDEALLHDRRHLGPSSWYPSSTSVRTIVGLVLATIGASLTGGTGDGAVAIEATEWEPGVSAWEYLGPLVQAANLRLWCDGARQWHLADADQAEPGHLHLAEGSNLVQLTTEVNRDRGRWHDAVVIRYQWRDSTTGDTMTAYDSAALAGWSRALLLTYTRPFPGAGAARAILARLAGHGRTLEATAQLDPTASPGQGFSATTLDGLQLSGRVGRVVMSLGPQGGDTMRVVPRDLLETPPDSWAAVPATTTWASIDPTTTWANYAPPNPDGVING